MSNVLRMDRRSDGCGITLRLQRRYGCAVRVASMGQGENPRLRDLINDCQDHPVPVCPNLRRPTHRHGNDVCLQVERNYPEEFNRRSPNSLDGVAKCDCHSTGARDLGIQPQAQATAA